MPDQSKLRYFYGGLYFMSALYTAAGIIHFVSPDFYLRIMPLWLPWHVFLVSVSGLAEIVLGILLIPKSTRRFSAWLIIAMLVVYFFVIHVPMAIDYQQSHNPSAWITWLRLPIQFLLIGWAYMYAKKYG